MRNSLLFLLGLLIECSLFGQSLDTLAAKGFHEEGKFQNAIRLLEDQENLPLAYQLILADSYLNIGRNDLALEKLKSAEEQVGVKKDLTAAACYEDLGIAYWNNGNKAIALNYHNQALQIKLSLLEAKDVRIADSYNNIGLIYLEDEFLQAIINFDKALTIYKEELGDEDPKVALVYSNLSFANSSQKNYQDAIRYMDVVASIWDKSLNGDHPNKAFTLSNQGLIYAAQGDYEKALSKYEQALKMYKSLYGEKHPEIANTYFLLGSTYREISEWKKGLWAFHKSIYANIQDTEKVDPYTLPEELNFYNADILLSSLQAKARLLESLHFEKTLKPKELIAALETYSLADKLISRIRQLRKNDRDKLRLAKLASEIYEDGIRIALVLRDGTLKKAKYESVAFQFMERSKSAILLEAIAETNAKSFAGIPQKILNDEDSLKTQISYLEQLLAKNSEDSQELEERLFEYEKAYRNFVSDLEDNYPQYFDLKYSESELSIEEIQSTIPTNTALISYFTGDRNIYTAILDQKGLEVIETEKPEDFSSIINSYRNALKYQIQNVFQSQAKRLKEILIPDVSNYLQLVIVPDGILGTIPFEALLDESGKYMIQNHGISYDYAAQLWYKRFLKEAITSTNILLNAPIDFTKNEVRMSKLPATKKEINEIKYLFKSFSLGASVRLKNEASEINLKNSDLSQYKYLHFATHGLVNESKPQLSRIFLYPDTENEGSLYAGEIYNLKIGAELVTLSACETGLGKVEKGEGILGLSRALLYAGAKNLLVSQWKVADQSTAQLMIDMYQSLLTDSGNKPLQSHLRTAKLKMMGSDTFSAPYYWAPFVLVGY